MNKPTFTESPSNNWKESGSARRKVSTSTCPGAAPRKRAICAGISAQWLTARLSKVVVASVSLDLLQILRVFASKSKLTLL